VVLAAIRIVVLGLTIMGWEAGQILWDGVSKRVTIPFVPSSSLHHLLVCRRVGLLETATLKGGRFHPKLNTDRRPIAHKYREGKVKRTLERELNST